jgi:glutaminyl-peptide cyclotransferase
MRKPKFILYTIGGALLLVLSAWLIYRQLYPSTHFDGKRAYQDVVTQVNFGPRTPGSPGHEQTVNFIQHELVLSGWHVDIENTTWLGYSVENIIATRPSPGAPIIIGAHYDSRLLADQDTGLNAGLPVPGANDGASGVAILLELARTLPQGGIPVELVFFDAEDNGNIGGRQWIMGSHAFVAGLTEKPKAAIILDMVGDAHLNIYIERNSDPALTQAIWSQAAALGYADSFIDQPKYDMIDDHTPFIEAGIPAVDIIDFDYPYWHTTADTSDKVSAKSLQTVGETIWEWIVNKK